jgi:enoyl-CoA hydratase/carnithine racemase
VSVPNQFSIAKTTPTYWRITFHNAPINLVAPETVRELGDVVTLLEGEDAPNVVVFDSAHPEFFMARYDLARAADTPTAPGPTGLPAWVDVTTRLTRLPVISIACIRGRTRGAGSEFALACDLRYASRERALLGQPEVGAGVFPGGGAIERLPALVGRSRALEIVAGADDYEADMAERYGWITRSVPDAELDGFVDDFAWRLAGFERTALAQAKHLINLRTLPRDADLVESHQAFFAATQSPAAKVRGQRLREVAQSAGIDFELRLGHYLGTA